MSSSNALKYNISVTTSIYGGVVVFVLHFFLIVLFLAIFELTWLSAVFALLLLAIAIYQGQQSYAQTCTIRLNDAAQVEVVFANKQLVSAEIGQSSFYNGFFLCLHLQSRSNQLFPVTKHQKLPAKFIVIYKDAIKKEEYRLLARLINLGH